MTASARLANPGLKGYVQTLKSHSVEANIEHLIALLKRRQIHNSRQCAIATLHLYLRLIASHKIKSVDGLLDQIRKVGRRLIAAQPREMVVGNIVKRVLALVREVAEGEPGVASPGNQDAIPAATPSQSQARPPLNFGISFLNPLRHGVIGSIDPFTHAEESGDSSPQSSRPPLLPSFTSAAPFGPPTSLYKPLFELFSTPEGHSPASTPGQATPTASGHLSAPLPTSIGGSAKDIKADVIEGVREMLDELDQVDEQIANHALDQIHANEVILTHTSSMTVQHFLLTAAKKRKFTVVYAETFPNDHEDTRSMILHGRKQKTDDEQANEEENQFQTLTAAGINVVIIPDSAVYAIMSRVNKVILATHIVLANGALVAAAGAKNIAMAAAAHKTRVVVLTGVYKLSPVDTFDSAELIEFGDSGKAAPYDDGEFVAAVEVVNPVYDYVPASLVDLYITNIGGYTPSHLHRIVSDHYSKEDIGL